MNGEKESKIKGWRKAGVAVSAIGALTAFKDTMSFKIAVLIAIIAAIEIACQTFLDYGKRPPKIT
jgi:hypothetical protein